MLSITAKGFGGILATPLMLLAEETWFSSPLTPSGLLGALCFAAKGF